MLLNWRQLNCLFNFTKLLDNFQVKVVCFQELLLTGRSFCTGKVSYVYIYLGQRVCCICATRLVKNLEVILEEDFSLAGLSSRQCFCAHEILQYLIVCKDLYQVVCSF